MKKNSKLIIFLKHQWLFLAIIIVLLILFPSVSVKPIEDLLSNQKSLTTLKEEVEAKQNELDSIKEANKRKAESAKKATVKDFFKITGSGDVRVTYAPMFENIITMIKQNGIRMKSIRYVKSIPNDNLVKKGGGVYNGCQVDFVLVGYYQQFADLLNEIDIYPYFISISKFKVTPYEYDKRILIADLSIVFYSKR
ncbi:hypothetical protein IJS77_04840 [bacterium]|nr:hypothetical protein [bacterium]